MQSYGGGDKGDYQEVRGGARNEATSECSELPSAAPLMPDKTNPSLLLVASLMAGAWRCRGRR